MEEQKENQVSRDLKNKLSKSLKKAQAPKVPEQEQQVETPQVETQEESHEQAQMNPEQVQAFRESLHNPANYRMEKLLQRENQWNAQRDILIEFGTALFERLDRIALALEKLGEPANETQ